MPRQSSIRAHPSQWSFRLHRISGLALVCYLPVHFLVLAGELGAGGGDSTAPWFASSVSRGAHIVLAGLLAAHLAGGVRVLAIQYLGLSRRQGLWLTITVSVGFAAAISFALAVRVNS